MNIFKKVFIGSGVLFLVYWLALRLFPHQDVENAPLLNHACQMVLLLVSLSLWLKEPNRNNKFIFFNFFLAFLVAVLDLVNDFIGYALFAENKYANIFFWQYSSIACFFFLALGIGYLVIDTLFHELKTYLKYVSIVTILLLFFGFYFFPYAEDSLTLYKTEDILQWKTLYKYLGTPESETAGQLLKSGDRHALAVELATHVQLQSWKDASPVGDLYPDKNFTRIEALVPYLEGNNYMILVLSPMYMDIFQVNVLLLGFIVLFFGYQYSKDPPQGAYIDKIMFIFLLFCSMEILHNWAFNKSLEWKTWNDLSTIGQYVTVCIEALMVLFFALRLHFITSVQGEFYETELAANPQRITRWRDWIDNLILSQFFNFKIFNGRMFQDTSRK